MEAILHALFGVTLFGISSINKLFVMDWWWSVGNCVP